MNNSPQRHASLPWHMVAAYDEISIYLEDGHLIAIVTRQSPKEMTEANACFILRACRHHHELTRLVIAASRILTNACNERWPGVGVSKLFAREFCRQATELLHQMEKPD